MKILGNAPISIVYSDNQEYQNSSSLNDGLSENQYFKISNWLRMH